MDVEGISGDNFLRFLDRGMWADRFGQPTSKLVDSADDRRAFRWVHLLAAMGPVIVLVMSNSFKLAGYRLIVLQGVMST